MTNTSARKQAATKKKNHPGKAASAKTKGANAPPRRGPSVEPAPTRKPAQATPATTIATRVLATLPPLATAAYDAYLGQTTAAERASLGGRTRAPGVLRDAGGWIASIASAHAKFGDAIRYDEDRIAFLCQLTLALADEIAAARAGRTGAVAAGSLSAAALASARAVRDDLLHALGQIVRGSPDASTLADVERDLRHDDQLAIALGKLADLADAWLERANADEGAAALVKGARLKSADSAAARTAAAALVGASADKGVAGRQRTQDTPDVNLAEGSVLAEMRVAKQAFAAAHKVNPKVPELVAGPATRDVLGTHARAKTPPKTVDPAPGPTPPTGPAVDP